MASQIDETKPVAGNPQTADERANWATAKGEISALQTATQGSPFLPLAGATMQGPIVLANDPTAIMHPVTLGYFQANGGGGPGAGGIPEAPADGTLYGRQDGGWHHAVNTAELMAAPFLPLSGGTLSGMLTLSGPPTIALHPATKGYTDATFVPFAGGTFTGPIVLYADPAAALQPVTLQYLQAQRYVPQRMASTDVSVVENTTGSDRGPTIVGNVTPYNATSDYLKLAARRLATPNAGNNFDGPTLILYGPTFPGASGSNSYFQVNTGNIASGYKTLTFDAGGNMSIPGNLTVSGNTGTGTLNVGGLATLGQVNTGVGYFAGKNIVLDASGVSTAVTFSETSAGALAIWSNAGSNLTSAAIYAATINLNTSTCNVNGTIQCGNAFPVANNVYNCGLASNAWAGVYSYYYGNSSDAKYKTDIAPLPDCLGIMQALQPKQFKWTNAAENDPHRDDAHWGFIAQDVEQAMTGQPFGGHRVAENGDQSISYHELMAVLWKACQEMAARVEAAEGRLAVLGA